MIISGGIDLSSGTMITFCAVILGFVPTMAAMLLLFGGAASLMARAITQNPVGIGYETVKAAVDAIHGKELPPIIDTGFYYYTRENIDDPKIAAVLIG